MLPQNWIRIQSLIQFVILKLKCRRSKKIKVKNIFLFSFYMFLVIACKQSSLSTNAHVPKEPVEVAYPYCVRRVLL